MQLSDGQIEALSELRRLDAAGDAIELVSVDEPTETGSVTITVSIDTRFPATDAGVNLRPREEIVVSIPAAFPWSKPCAEVRHRRWAGTNHVNWGFHLCLYLAPDVAELRGAAGLQLRDLGSQLAGADPAERLGMIPGCVAKGTCC